MATVTGGRIFAVEAKRDKQEAPKGMSMNVEIVDVTANKDELAVHYSFTVNYQENVARMKLDGIVTIKEDDAKKAAEIAKQFKEKTGPKKVPDDFAEMVMNYVTYVAGVSGTFISQPLGLNAPIAFMPIRVQPQTAAPKQSPMLPRGKESAA